MGNHLSVCNYLELGVALECARCTTGQNQCSRHGERDLAERLVRLKASMSILDLLEREDRVDYGLNTSLLEQRHNFFCECVGDDDLLLQRSRAEHCADDVQTLS